MRVTGNFQLGSIRDILVVMIVGVGTIDIQEIQAWGAVTHPTLHQQPPPTQHTIATSSKEQSGPKCQARKGCQTLLLN